MRLPLLDVAPIPLIVPGPSGILAFAPRCPSGIRPPGPSP
jgi:hypothetical protein